MYQPVDIIVFSCIRDRKVVLCIEIHVFQVAGSSKLRGRPHHREYGPWVKARSRDCQRFQDPGVSEAARPVSSIAWPSAGS